MEPELSQNMAQPSPEMEEDSKASLGFSTMLRENLFQQENPGALEDEEVATEDIGQMEPEVEEGESDMANELSAMEERLSKEIAEIKEELKGGGKNQEVEALRKELLAVLNEDEDD